MTTPFFRLLLLQLACAALLVSGCDVDGRDPRDQRTVLPGNETRGLELRPDMQTAPYADPQYDEATEVSPRTRFNASWRLIEPRAEAQASLRRLKRFRGQRASGGPKLSAGAIPAW